ncbi:hypothetical protein CAPN002_26050 [Capnocytophaga stomatis]|uniref:hypothetical protein n=1 Tax=Capnocytophaga stomatis TaxID=1848904 RepID=UPI001950173E|nr:hypothetical protein [Capnocytophaga stomatis]GIJ95387.1 hypothetical protein CAPN002_26050 [Capnocytophaga stomatis]
MEKNKENKKITLGVDFYQALKRNNVAVYCISAVAIIISLGALYLTYQISANYQYNIYAVDSKGEIIPLRLLNKEDSRDIEIKANLDRFVDLYLEMDGLSMKAKQEKLLWLLGEDPTRTMKDKINKGYFNEFINIAGLQQKAYILGNTLNVTRKEPYKAQFTVRIQRINADVSKFYNCDIELEMINVSRNYPLNPFGLLITKFNERLYQIDPNEEMYIKQEQQAKDEFNQNIIKSKKDEQGE